MWADGSSRYARTNLHQVHVCNIWVAKAGHISSHMIARNRRISFWWRAQRVYLSLSSFNPSPYSGRVRHDQRVKRDSCIHRYTTYILVSRIGVTFPHPVDPRRIYSVRFSCPQSSSTGTSYYDKNARIWRDSNPQSCVNLVPR